ncbi:MAG: FAD-binding protein [Deltaproteobacteria bacterium]|nr:FAD-binding protein [Deltaproteobacteria bacterium]
MSKTLVIGEMFEGAVRNPTLSAVTFALKLKEIDGAAFDVLLPGSGAADEAGSIKGCGAEKILTAQGDDLETYTAEAYAPLVAEVVGDGGYDRVVCCASAYGKDLMPRAAAILEAGMASDVVDVEKDGDTLVYVRPMYAGNVLARMAVKSDVHVVTVRQSEWGVAETSGAGDAAIESVDAADPEDARGGVEITGFDKLESERPPLTEASIVVSGGRGLKSAENFKMLEELADLLGGAVGATRAVVDAGFVPNDLQVGQTGKIVAPDLYFAIGLSGAIQHIAGMKSSKVIVAVNKDEEAPIFSVADYGMVADLFTVLPEIIESVKKLKTA